MVLIEIEHVGDQAQSLEIVKVTGSVDEWSQILAALPALCISPAHMCRSCPSKLGQ